MRHPTVRGLLVFLPVALLLASPGAAQERGEPPAWRREIERRIEARATLDLPDASIEEAAEFIADLGGVNVVLLPGIDPETPAELELRDVRLSDAIRLLAGSAGAASDLIAGAVVIGRPEEVAYLLDCQEEFVEAPANPGAADAQLLGALDRTITLNVDELPATEAIAFVHDLSGISIAVAQGARGPIDRTTVTLRAEEVTLRQALFLLLAPHGFRVRVRDGTLEVRWRAP